VRRCIVCDSPGPYQPVFEQDGRRLVRCGGCTLVFQDPPPPAEELAGFYYHDRDFSDALLGELRAWTLARAREKLALLRGAGALPAAGHVLDVGCSSGAWLEVAAAQGLRATGVEVGARTAAAARARGLDVRTGELAEVAGDLEEAGHDLITFWDVLEHLPDPRRELALASRLLAPGGAIAATMPNVEGLYPRLTHRLLARSTGVWEYPELPVHLYDFSPRTIVRLLEREGYRAGQVRTFATPFAFYRATSLSRTRLGGGPRALGLRAAFEALRLAVYPLARALDRGNSLFVAARPG
jgi:SAM-dependent methyltransferase